VSDAEALSVLVVDDEEHLRYAIEQTLELAELACDSCARAAAALERVHPDFAGILLSDIRMPGIDGVELMRRAHAIDPELPVILVTGHGDIELAVQVMRDGAYDFLEKPYDPDRLLEVVRRALDKRRLTLENRRLRAQLPNGDAVQRQLQGSSREIAECRDAVRTLAGIEADVLVVGDTGAGKEVVARCLHATSARAAHPFVHINCAALPESMIECELFGHEAGAFPGALKRRVGKFAQAHRGVICLDEIDSLPLAAQATLLDVLHRRAITPIGSNQPVELDFRVIALSKRDLEDDAMQERFRRDLLYRLNVVTLRVPSLLERMEDAPGLFATLVARAAALHQRTLPDVSAAVLERIAAHDWPGNVRELGNSAERFVLGLDLAIGGDGQHGAQAGFGGVPRGSLSGRLAAFEKAQIAAAIVANRGRLKETYETLGLSRKTLYDKMQKHGMSRRDYTGDA